jgi:hypothetical protein
MNIRKSLAAKQHAADFQTIIENSLTGVLAILLAGATVYGGWVCIVAPLVL